MRLKEHLRIPLKHHGWGEDWYDRVTDRIAILNDKPESATESAEAEGQPWWKAYYLPYILGFEK
jgi:hypothetical protein